MKPIKHKLTVMALLIISVAGFCQTPQTFTYSVQAGTCIFSDSAANNLPITNSVIISPPLLGTMAITGTGAFKYCAPDSINDTTSAVIYGCVTDSGGSICDTFLILFNITTGTNCNFHITLTQDTGMACIGGNSAYTVATYIQGTPPYTYLWRDSSTTSSACALNPGMGNCVTVTDANNCSATACSYSGCQLSVNIVPIMNYCGNSLPALGASVTGGANLYSFSWNNNSTGSTICGLTPGVYCVTVSDINGCTGTSCYSVYSSAGCFFSHAQIPNPQNVNQVNFTGSSMDSVSNIVTWLWSFGDGGHDTVQSPIHIYNSPGQYYVYMSVFYSNGDSCSFSDYIYVTDDSSNFPGCQAYFYSFVDSSNNNTFHFIDFSAYNPISWTWSFGDGGGSTLQYPTHVYASQGNYTVCLTTTDMNGCTSNYCEQISNIPVQDLEAYLFHQTTVTPGFPVWVYLDYYNAGTILVNGTVTYRYPEGTTFTVSSIAPSAHDAANRLLTFNVGNIMPGTSDYVYVNLTASSSLALGTLANDTMWINPIAGDATPANNVSFVQDSVVGSWDPNDKAVSPKGEGAHGIVPMSTNELSYRIRFQNTGTAPAQIVQIRDAISNNIDLASVRITDASHIHTTETIGNELVVTFANINLPDSGANYAASQGYIYIRAKLKPGLINGTQIFNTADIYFDFNAPVITNTVESTLGSYILGIGEPSNLDFAIMPNPANNQISIRGEFVKNTTYELLNQLGQVVLNGNIYSNNTAVDVADLSSGIYFVRVKSGEKSAIQKLMVAK